MKGGTIRDVARRTGLSTATISRVMNGTGKVSPDTHKRVLEACEELDYLPNPAARALTTRKSRTVAAIIPTIENSVFAKYVSAVEAALAEQGYALVLALSNGDQGVELAAARKLLGMGAEAFILSGAAHDPALIDLLGRRQIPYLFSSVHDTAPDTVTIGYDNAALAAGAVDLLAAKGHRRIAVIHGPADISDRTVARCEGVESRRGKLDALAFFETPLNAAGGKAATRDILERYSTATAILCLSDVLALGTYFALAEAGKRIPDDVSVMGFDNLDWAKHAEPPLTTINLPARRMGRMAAEQVIERLERNTALSSVLIEGEFIQRGSVRNL